MGINTVRAVGLVIATDLIAVGVDPVNAHEVEVAGDVAATFHIEPSHNPKAGEPAQAWFALTKQGGELIPLSQCNCKLAVYAEPYAATSTPVLQPPLTAIAVEQYQGIPGADFIFPKAGNYKLVLRGSPNTGDAFKPFELSYSVTVRAGTTPGATSPQPSPSASSTPSSLTAPATSTSASTISGGTVAIAIIVLATLGLVGWVWWRSRPTVKK